MQKLTGGWVRARALTGALMLIHKISKLQYRNSILQVSDNIDV